MKRAFWTIVALSLVGAASAQVQDYSRRQKEAPLTMAETGRVIDSALRLLSTAGRQIETTLPVYGGRRQQAKYKVVFAMEDLNAAKNSGGRQPGRQPRLESVSERLRRIPAVKEQPRRDYMSSQLRTSDQAMNEAGLSLLDARGELDRIKADPSGRLTMCRRLIDLAVEDIRRSIGRITDPRPKQKRDQQRVGTGGRGR